MHENHPKRWTRPCIYYQQGKCNRPNCNFSHDLAAFADQTSSGMTLNPLSDDPSRLMKPKACRYFARGRCTAGDSCRWSHEEGADGEYGQEDSGGEDGNVPDGFKIVPKSYRTQPCARFERGYCMYGEQCTFIHTSPQPSSAPTPSVRSPNGRQSLTQMVFKSHSQVPSPAVPTTSLNGVSTRSVASVPTPPSSGSMLPSTSSNSSGVAGATSAVMTPSTSRELPPPSSQPQLSGTNWGVPLSASANSNGSIGPNKVSTPVFASSPLLSAGNGEWSHPPLPPSNNTNPSGAKSSPYLFTFGEIAPNYDRSATSSSHQTSGLGLNGAKLATPGAIKVSGLGSFSSPSSAVGLSSPLGSGPLSADVSGNPGRSLGHRKNMSSFDINIPLPIDTEPDFPSITYLNSNHSANGHENGNSGSVDENHSYSQSPWPQHNGVFENGQNNGGYPTDDEAYKLRYKTRPCKFFVAGSQCPSGSSCTFIHDPTAIRRSSQTVHPLAYSVQAPPPPGPEHPLYRTRECKYHLAGQCHQGDECAFKHTGPPGQGREYENWEGFSIKIKVPDANEQTAFRSRPCKWFLKGNCFHGENCTYLHEERARPSCIFWRNGTGNCMNGDNCRFSHDIYEESEVADEQSEPSERKDAERPQAPSFFEPYFDGNVGVSHTNGLPPSLSFQNGMIVSHRGSSISLDQDHRMPNGRGHQQNLGQEDPTLTYLNGSGVLMDGDSQPNGRMEVYVSEGEEDDDEDDVIVMKPSNDPADQSFPRFFSNLSISSPIPTS